jgi:mannitol-1-/sugar-/sorbitol-6-/2-deoxyglucose-6-phosphatase
MLNTVLFDMDGLLIDSEPFWEEAGKELMQQYNVTLTAAQYHISTGLRTEEWVQFWFNHFNIEDDTAQAIETIVTKAIDKIARFGEPLPGVHYILEYFKSRHFKIGLATSSPMSLVDVVVNKLNISNYLQAISSAEKLPYGKPHPQVYMNCAAQLHATPLDCICFEDSFNGMIAAKAARMKCVVVPSAALHNETRWSAADLKISSLQNFNDLLLQGLVF